jgi:Fe2+ transport system protein B
VAQLVAKGTPLLLVGNKVDIGRRVVDKDRAIALASSIGIHYVETSAKKGEGVDTAFTTLAGLAVEPYQ